MVNILFQNGTEITLCVKLETAIEMELNFESGELVKTYELKNGKLISIDWSKVFYVIRDGEIFNYQKGV